MAVADPRLLVRAQGQSWVRDGSEMKMVTEGTQLGLDDAILGGTETALIVILTSKHLLVEGHYDHLCCLQEAHTTVIG